MKNANRSLNILLEHLVVSFDQGYLGWVNRSLRT